MTENIDKTEGIDRRSVIKAAAWAAPVVAVAVSAPMAAATTVEPEEAESIGATTTSPQVGNVGRISPFGIDPLGDPGLFPAGQTFTLTSSTLDFDSNVLSITGGSLQLVGPGEWLITPLPDSTAVDIRFNSPVPGTYTLTSNGPIDAGQTWGGTVVG